MNELKYIVYCRKSSEEDTKQAQSLETQENELKAFAKNKNINIVEIVKEQRSAKIDGNRPKFTKILSDIREGKANALLVLYIDRLSRNGIEAGQLVKLFEQGFLKEIRTPHQVFSTLQDMNQIEYEFMGANRFSRDLSIKVRYGNKTKLEKGEYPTFAPIGYINKPHTIVPNPKIAPFIIKTFELFATGQYSLRTIVKEMYVHGLRSNTGKKVAKSSMHRILRRPEYYGVIYRKGSFYKSNHKKLIDKSLFDTVQQILDGKSIRPKKQIHEFLYRDFLSCGECNCKITAVLKKKRYIYYYCTNGKGICIQHINYLGQKLVQILFQP